MGTDRLIAALFFAVVSYVAVSTYDLAGAVLYFVGSSA